MDVYYVYYRSRRPGDVEMDWEEQVVETVNNTINHMVSAAMLMTMMRWEEKMLKVSKMSAKKYNFKSFGDCQQHHQPHGECSVPDDHDGDERECKHVKK